MSNSKIWYRDFYTYSMMQTLYEWKKSYLETFFPFIMNSIDIINWTKLKKIQNDIKNRYYLNIPNFTIKDILKKLDKQNKIIYDEKSDIIQLTEKWKKEKIDSIDLNKDIYFELERLFESIRLYIYKDNNIRYEDDIIYKTLQDIINNNFYNFFEFFSPFSKSYINWKLDWVDNVLKVWISRFVVNQLNNNLEFKNLIKNIVYWALLCSLITKENLIKDVNNEYNLNSLTVFLDTNIIFSLIWWHWKELEKSSFELLELMQKRGISVKVFTFTIDETINVLENFQTEKDKYFKWYNVASIYQNFKNLWYGTSDILQLTYKIENILIQKFWVEIYEQKTSKLDYNEDDYEEEINHKPRHSKKHDIYAIESIKFLRWSSSPRLLEKSKYIFLTSDKRLFNADCKINEKSFFKKIPNIILPDYLSNYLWLKKPDWSSDIPLETVFVWLTSYWLINKDVWNNFYALCYEMVEKKEITDEDFALLISSNEIKNELLTISVWEKIDKNIIFTNIDKSKKNLEITIHNEILEEVKKWHKSEIEKKLEEEKQRKNKDILEKLKNKNIKIAWILSWVISFIIFIILCSLFVIFIIPPILKNWDLWEWILYFISFFFLILYIILWVHLKNFIFRKKINDIIFLYLFKKDKHYFITD